MDEAAGVGGDEPGGGGGGEAVVEHGVEEQRVGLGKQRGVDDDALGEGGVLLEAQAAGEERMADEPDGEVLAAVEVEAGEAVEIMEEVVGQALGVVEDENGHDLRRLERHRAGHPGQTVDRRGRHQWLPRLQPDPPTSAATITGWNASPPQGKNWQKGARVRYCVCFVSADGPSSLGPWCDWVPINDKAFTTLKLPIAPKQSRTNQVARRIVIRQFDNDTAVSVGEIKDNVTTTFSDKML